MDALSSLALGVFTFVSAILGAFSNTATYLAPAFVPRPPEVRIIFGGDMMFDRTIRVAMERRGEDYVLACLDPVLKTADIVVANLEGPITSAESVSVGSVIGSPENFTFTFAPSVAPLLAAHNIRIVNIGNNHIMNFSREGLIETKRHLDEAGVQHFGDPDQLERERVLRTTHDGLRFSFVNWSDWTSDKTDHTVAQVREEAEAGSIVVVYAHWGDEYVAPPERVKILARQFIDAGAEIVIGSHPHIVQEHEVYAGKHIYYSLGNMVFDQYWTEEVRTGLMLSVVFGKRGVQTLEEIPIELLRDGRTCPLSAGE